MLRAQIASILALILAWVYIFDTVLKEREQLEAPKEGIVGAVPRDVEAPPPPPAGVTPQPAAAQRPANGPPAPRQGEGLLQVLFQHYSIAGCPGCPPTSSMSLLQRGRKLSLLEGVRATWRLSAAVNK